MWQNYSVEDCMYGRSILLVAELYVILYQFYQVCDPPHHLFYNVM